MKLDYTVVHQQLSELKFLEPNPDYDETVQWTRELHQSRDRSIICTFWTATGRLRTTSFDKTQLTTNVAVWGSLAGRKREAVGRTC